MSNNKRNKKKGIFGVASKRSWQIRPFGKFSEAYSSESDSSDFDYDPEEGRDEQVKNKNRKRKAKTNDKKHYEMQDNYSKKRKIDNKKNPPKVDANIHWENLPTEILIKVFSNVLKISENIGCLLRCGLVCKQWNYACSHPSLWRKIDLAFMGDSKKANDKALGKLINKRGEDIFELSLTGWSKLTNKGLMVISEKCHNLQTICLSKCMKSSGKKNISSESIMKLIEKCKLKKFDISWLPTDSCCNKIIRFLIDQRGAQLESLNLCGCPIGFSTLQYIQASSPNLRVLDLSNTRVLYLSIEKLQIGCPALEELYLANLRIDFAKSNSKEQDSSPGFSYMIALSINTSNLTDEILLRVLKNACNLKLLDLRQCEGITIECLEKLQACSLEQLYLSRSRSIRSLPPILQKWHHSLIELDLSWVSPLLTESCFDDMALERIAKNNPQMERLAILDLTGTPVTDAGLKSVLSLCPNLNELNLTSCKALARGLKHKHDKTSVHKLRTTENLT